MRLSMLYLLSALAVAVVPLSAAAQESASLPTAASGDACAIGWRWVPAGYNKETEWASGHCERIPVPPMISASETVPVGTMCPTGSRWVPAGYNKETEWAPRHCGPIPGSAGSQARNYTPQTPPVAMNCPPGYHWVASGYNRQAEWDSAHCAED
jgi:hypothetical protein